MKWLKLYVDIAQNPRMKLLAFEDRWHYISLLCAKAEGYLDEREQLRDRMVSVHLGLTPVEVEHVKDRLIDVGLISSDWQIYNWDEKQSADATGAARKRRERARKKAEKESAVTTKEVRNKNIEQEVTVTGQSRDSHATEKEEAVERIWELFPKKVAKARCVKKLEKLSMTSLAEIEKDLRARVWPTEMRYILNPETYINQERWLDEISMPGSPETDSGVIAA